MSDPKLQEYMDQTVCSFSEAQNEIADALARIKTQLGGAAAVQQIQLLALRRYLRKGGHQVALAWPWTKKERDLNAAQTKKMNTAADKTIENFAKQNPKLTLARSAIRDLASQVRLWCDNPHVKTAASKLLPKVLKELDKDKYPEIPTDSGPITLFKKFLKGTGVDPEPTSAAPGTSDHGQDRAVDFIVKKGGKTVADINKSKMQTQWIDTGYDKLLKTATDGTGLEGPLMKDGEIWEAWHYALPKEKKTKAK
jgi:hypothetical protein